ncbi:MAG: hypothetical protein J5712_02090, partial [Lachnospiraceae bacterium]|nr:hypothetical protein [Lachnospiraceae bacterium]
MKKLLKRSIAILLVLLTVLSLAACKGKDTGDTNQSGGTQNTGNSGNSGSSGNTGKSDNKTDDKKTDVGNNETKSYDEHYTYSYASIQITESTDYNSPDDAMTQYWEQKYNFDWDIISISSDKWDQTVNTWAYAEDLPDVTIFDYKHPQMMDWVDQGLVFKFPKGWQERWPNIARVQEYAGLQLAFEDITGDTYFLARANYANNLPCTPGINPTNMMVYIRKDWAEAVGIEIKDYYT